MAASSGRSTPRRGPLPLLLAGAGVLGLLLVLALVGTVLWLRPSVPPDQAVLERRLGQLEHADVDALLEELPAPEDPRQLALLEHEEARPTAGLVEHTEIRDRKEIAGHGVQYLILVTQEGAPDNAVHRMEAPADEESWSAGRLGISTLTTYIPPGSVGLRINGVDFTVDELGRSNRTLELWVIPGQYRIEALGPGEGQIGEPETHVVGLPPKDITVNPPAPV
ncbi:hypothetical protein ACT3SP_09095 [Brachybacterium sp. AOP43-C2-M15]|uniref:hypothetical protein n=1 Tax=Brachybacterium sp. AOP43-C2-M15 TaxID=3457661 RepID=UPI004033A6A9